MQCYLETTQLFIHTYWLSRKETANKNKVQKTQVGKISELSQKSNMVFPNGVAER